MTYKAMLSLCFCLSAAIVLSSCETDGSTNPPIEPTADLPPPVSSEEIDEVMEHIDTDEKDGTVPTKQTTEDGEGVTEDTTSLNDPAMPMEVNKKVAYWIDYFTKKNPRTIKRYLQRGLRYKKVITRILREQGLPDLLFYVPMIESGFNHKAVSSARATGTWQFMQPTGKRYGLNVNYFVDERRDPLRSTIAASLYLADLHNVFQSWYLAMAAYNAGEMRIMSAIMGGNSRDFWTLVKAKKLPRETMRYVPKFIAAATIGENPERYGIDIGDIEPFDPAAVEVPSPVSLADIAKITGVKLSVLQDYNPHIKRGVTPPGGSHYKLWVPHDTVASFKENYDAIAQKRIHYKNRHIAQRQDIPASGYHKVKRGETLHAISRKYGMTLAEIKRNSGIKTSNIYPGQKIKLVSGNLSYKRYRVRQGDNLHNIAKRFDTTVGELKKMNRLGKNLIYSGQLLKVGRNRG
jgi:membrane-bound lytic murein transglycosylase D